MLTVPGEEAQRVVDRVVRAGVKAILNFAPTQLQAPADVAVKTVNMAMELEGLELRAHEPRLNEARRADSSAKSVG